MLGELFRGEDKLAGRHLGGLPIQRILVGVYDQLSGDRHRFVLGVVEVQSSAEAADGRLSHLGVERIGPDGGQPFGNPRVAARRLLGRGVGRRLEGLEVHSLAAGQQAQDDRRSDQA